MFLWTAVKRFFSAVGIGSNQSLFARLNWIDDSTERRRFCSQTLFFHQEQFIDFRNYHFSTRKTNPLHSTKFFVTEFLSKQLCCSTFVFSLSRRCCWIFLVFVQRVIIIIIRFRASLSWSRVPRLFPSFLFLEFLNSFDFSILIVGKSSWTILALSLHPCNKKRKCFFWSEEFKNEKKHCFWYKQDSEFWQECSSRCNDECIRIMRMQARF